MKLARDTKTGGERPEFRRSRARACDPRESVVSLLFVAAAIVLAVLSTTARGATYKWVDDKGVVHYTDKMPTEAVNKGSTMLDKQARPVKKIEPPPSPEQIRAREEEAEQQRANAKVNEEAMRRDRALIQSYTTEAEIELAKNRAIATIDAQITSSRAYTAQLTKRREELELRKAKVGNKALPPALERELEANDAELAKTATLIESKRREMGAIVARYDADRQRWRDLRAVADANASAAAAAASTARVHPAAAPSAATSTRK